MTRQTVEEYILNLEGAQLSYPYGQELAVYSFKGEMFGLLEVGKRPLRLSLRCDPLLAKVLKERFEEVMPGHKLNQDKWITIVTSGQLKPDEIKDLINHSYQLVSKETSGTGGV